MDATECEFKNSQIYNIIKYPLISLQLGAVYVPHMCVCSHDASDTGDHLESQNNRSSKVGSGVTYKYIDPQSQTSQSTTRSHGVDSSARINSTIEEGCGRRIIRFYSELFGHKITDAGREKPGGAGSANSRQVNGEEKWTGRPQDGQLSGRGRAVLENEIAKAHQLRKAWNAPEESVLKSTDGSTARICIGKGWLKKAASKHEDAMSWKVFKATQSVVFLLLRLGELCRCAFVTAKSYSDDNAFVYSLTQLINFSYCFFLYGTTFQSFIQDLPQLLGAWFEYEKKYGLHQSAEKFGKTSKTVLILCTLLQTLQTSGFMVAMFYNYEALRAQLWPYYEIDRDKRIYGILLVALASHMAFSILNASSFFLYVVLKMLRMEFAHQREELTAIFQDEPEGNRERRFENFLERMRALKGVMDKSCDVIKHMVALVYICVVPYVCCITYGVVSGSTKSEQLLMVIYSVVISMFLLVFTTLNCGYVYTEARSVWNVVYMFPWCKLSHSMMLKLSVFISQLTVENFGITVYGVFLVDRSTFLTIGGAIITYIVIVIQFKLDNGSQVVNGCLLNNESQLEMGSIRLR